MCQEMSQPVRTTPARRSKAETGQAGRYERRLSTGRVRDSEVAKVANFFHILLGDLANFFGDVANFFGDLASSGWRRRQLFLATSPSEKVHKANVDIP